MTLDEVRALPASTGVVIATKSGTRVVGLLGMELSGLWCVDIAGWPIWVTADEVETAVPGSDEAIEAALLWLKANALEWWRAMHEGRVVSREHDGPAELSVRTGTLMGEIRWHAVSRSWYVWGLDCGGCRLGLLRADFALSYPEAVRDAVVWLRAKEAKSDA